MTTLETIDHVDTTRIMDATNAPITYSYIGSGSYCTANTLAMLLATIGETFQPGDLDALTGVGIGAMEVPSPDGPLTLFETGDGMAGITAALHDLGFTVTSAAWTIPTTETDETEAWSRLRGHLDAGHPVMILADMGGFRHIPWADDLAGIGHFALVIAADDNDVTLHDPEGFPYATMPREAFMDAWSMRDAFGAAHGYPLWTAPQRIAYPTPKETLTALDTRITATIRDLAERDPSSAEVIQRLADRIERGELAPSHRDAYGRYLLANAARRANDLAAFIQPLAPDRALVKTQQSMAFGAAQSAFMRNDLDGTANALRAAAIAEDAFTRLTLD